MYALTVRQPWAAFIAAGVKLVENRTWLTAHRGTLAIHAGASPDREAQAAFVAHNVAIPPQTFGAIIAVADLYDCVRFADLPASLVDDPFASGPWCWLLRNVRRLDRPIICRGKLGLWTVPADIAVLLPIASIGTGTGSTGASQ